MSYINFKCGPWASILLFLWFAAIVFAAGALAPTVDQIMGWEQRPAVSPSANE